MSLDQGAAAPVFFDGPEHQPFEIGDGEAGAFLLHGFMGTPAEMRPLAGGLAIAGLTTRGSLLPGFGPDVSRLAEMDRHKWLAAAGAEWQALRQDHKQTVLIGFSMGAAVALVLAAEHPPDALVLIAPFWRSAGWQFNLLPVLRHLVPSIAPFEKANFDDPDVRRQMATMAPGIDLSDPVTQQFLREQVRLPLAVLDELRSLGKEAYAQAAVILTPTLVIQGRQDTVVQPKSTQRLLRRMAPGTIYEEIDADHTVIRMATPQTRTLDQRIVAFLSSAGITSTVLSTAQPPL